MLREMQKRMEEFHMIAPGDKVLAGVSGGADSVCLLLALQELQATMNFSLEVVHIEHGIRGDESIQDARFVEQLCRKMGVLCHTHTVDVPAYAARNGLGLEEAARRLRYEVFEMLAVEKNAKIALAHHQEDNAETILFQMVRGSSLTGLCGMQPVRRDEAGVCYIRPLLSWHREEIEAYLKSREMEWRVDSTNQELDYSRNYLRAKVLPELAVINAQAVEHMNQTAAHLSEIKAYLDIETEKHWKLLASEEERISIEIAGMLALHSVMQRQLAYKAITVAAGRKKDITSAHVEEVLSLCRGQSGKRISLPYGLIAWKEFDRLCLMKVSENGGDLKTEKGTYEVSAQFLQSLFERCVGSKEESVYTQNGKLGIAGRGFSCRVIKKSEENMEIPRKTYTKWLDYDKIKNGFCIRTRRSGDYFICDTSGHRKKLKEYFTDEKIPVAERDRRWLLAQENEVLWFVGGRISEHIKVTQETKFIFEITYDGGDKDE